MNQIVGPIFSVRNSQNSQMRYAKMRDVGLNDLRFFVAVSQRGVYRKNHARPRIVSARPAEVKIGTRGHTSLSGVPPVSQPASQLMSLEPFGIVRCERLVASDRNVL
jgi:hypothetical protein